MVRRTRWASARASAIPVVAAWSTDADTGVFAFGPLRPTLRRRRIVGWVERTDGKCSAKSIRPPRRSRPRPVPANEAHRVPRSILPDAHCILPSACRPWRPVNGAMRPVRDGASNPVGLRSGLGNSRSSRRGTRMPTQVYLPLVRCDPPYVCPNCRWETGANFRFYRPDAICQAGVTGLRVLSFEARAPRRFLSRVGQEPSHPTNHLPEQVPPHRPISFAPVSV